jgi:hypothetical protein
MGGKADVAVMANDAGLLPSIDFVRPAALSASLPIVLVVAVGPDVVLQSSGRGVSFHGLGLSPAQSTELAAQLHNAAVENKPTRMKVAGSSTQYLASRGLYDGANREESYFFKQGEATVFNHLVRTMRTSGKCVGSAVLSYLGLGCGATTYHTDGFAPHNGGRTLLKTAGWFYMNGVFYDCTGGCIISSHNVRNQYTYVLT